MRGNNPGDGFFYARPAADLNLVPAVEAVGLHELEALEAQVIFSRHQHDAVGFVLILFSDVITRESAFGVRKMKFFGAARHGVGKKSGRVLFELFTVHHLDAPPLPSFFLSSCWPLMASASS